MATTLADYDRTMVLRLTDTTHDIASTNDNLEPEAVGRLAAAPHYASGHRTTPTRWTHPAGIVPSSGTGGRLEAPQGLG